MANFADELTPSQREAVVHRDGPLLILAGPGSGKTRVITRRIARMVESGIDPRSILAITFTNKAAKEMAERVEALLPGRHVWISTFHKFCARMLRQCPEAVGLRSNFTIYDTSDQQQLIRRVLDELDVDTVAYPPARIAASISRAKNSVETASEFQRRFEERIGDHMQAVVAKVYPRYQRQLLSSNAVDFDDLLLHMVVLLAENPELRAELDRRFRYILVDEYQDTNLAQYQIVSALSHDEPNLCVTGDPDQSIYGWRGAEIGNILRFEADFPEATVIRLEHNFRSTKNILKAADSLIAHNVRRKEKQLITDNPEGPAVELVEFEDGRSEAELIARAIRQEIDSGRRTPADFAIFYRVNALSREIERALVRHHVPYQVAAGASFYDRAEIKDMLGYLRILQNPDDETALRRIINTPARGIGRTTVAKLAAWASAQGCSLLEGARRADEIPTLSARAKKSLIAFSKLVHDFANAPFQSVENLLHALIERTQYTRGLMESRREEDQERLANVEELLSAARQYDQAAGAEASLEGFLEEASLASEIDNVDQTAGQVTLMTLHAAKGLEFPVVYLLAVEHNLIPHERALQDGSGHELEEERRLLFVGITRAMQQLYLTRTHTREFRGRRLHSIPSSFLSEMPLTVEHRSDPSFELLAESPHDAADDSASRKERPERTQFPAVLTTAADLLNGTANVADIPRGYAVGMKVRHPQYGLGTVVGISGMSRNRTLTVEFDSSGTSKTFIAAKCPLEPVGTR